MLKDFAKTAIAYALVAVAIATLFVFAGVCFGMAFRGCNYVLTAQSK